MVLKCPHYIYLPQARQPELYTSSCFAWTCRQRYPYTVKQGSCCGAFANVNDQWGYWHLVSKKLFCAWKIAYSFLLPYISNLFAAVTLTTEIHLLEDTYERGRRALQLSAYIVHNGETEPGKRFHLPKTIMKIGDEVRISPQSLTAPTHLESRKLN